MQEWVRAARAGEQVAWTAIYNHYYPSMYAHALRLCASQAMAKDAVQEVFVTAYLKLEQLRDAATLGAWLRKILVHTCYRLQQRHNRYAPGGEQFIASDRYWEDTINTHTEELSQNNRLYAAVAQLPETLRVAMIMRYFSGTQSYEGIAAVLGIPIGTVRSRLNQSKIKLAEYWAQQPDADGALTRQNEEWNQYYLAHFGAVHKHDDAKDRLLGHLDKKLDLVFGSGNVAIGRHYVEKEIHDDREHGSWFEPVNAVSSGNISILEARNFNSPEYPHRCPPNVVFVLYRRGSTVQKLHFTLL